MLINIKNVKQILIQLRQIHPIYDATYRKKMKYLCKKHLILMIGVFLEQATYFAFSHTIWSRQYYIKLYYIIVLLLKPFKIIITYDIIGMKMEILLEDLLHLQKVKHLMHPMTLHVKLKNIRDFYEELHETVTLVNNTGGYTSLALFVLMLCFFSSSTYFLVLGILKNTQVVSFVRK